MIEFLFLDLDDTILDFHKAEHIALGKTFTFFGLSPEQHILDRYSLINQAHWQMLERRELTREQVLVRRFGVLFQEFGLPVDPEAVAAKYEENLSIGHYFLPGAEEAVKSLSKKYKLYLASNGTARVQAGRLKSAKLAPWFQEIFVSQAIGANKPDKAYFERCFAKIPGFERRKCMMVGDSLTSDIQGGINAGIQTCWVNPTGKKATTIRPDYEIAALSQLEDLLETIP